MQNIVCAIAVVTAVALVTPGNAGAQPNNLNPTDSLCLKLRNVSDENAQGDCQSEDSGCVGGPTLRCTDDDLDPLNGGICIDRDCFDVNDIVTVDVALGPTATIACGAQVFLGWDTDSLDYVDHVIEPESELGWDLHFVNFVNTNAGTLDLALGVPIVQGCNEASGTTDGGTILRLTLAVTAHCNTLDVRFRDFNFPTTVSGALGNLPIVGCNGDVDPSGFDVTLKSPPEWSCPQSSSGDADCGLVTREVLFPPISVDDPCEQTTTPAADLCTVTYFQNCTGDPDCEGLGTCVDGLCTMPTIPKGVELSALLDGGGDFLPGRTEFRCAYTNACGLSQTCAADIDNSGVFIPDNCPQILHVDQNIGAGDPDGVSWCTAFDGIQEALAAAAKTKGWVNEIRVARGTYRPALPDGDRQISFALIDGLSLVGSYAGCDASNPDDRNTVFYQTTLSGDLNGDDELEGVRINDNSFHIVTVDDTTQSSVIDGFTIAAATADDDKSPHDTGGGIYVTGGSVTVMRCVLRNNLARFGGAIGNVSGNTVVINSRFAFNLAIGTGGAINSVDSDLTLVNCTFGLNTANTAGGAIHGDATSTQTARNSIIWTNGATPISGDATVTHSIIQGGWPGQGNIDADPLFFNPASGVFQLSATSPALDAGDNTQVPDGVTLDIIGTPRFVNDPFSLETGNPGLQGAAVVDMGAFELLLGDSLQDGDVDSEDYQTFFDCSGIGPLPEECIAHDFDGDVDIDLLDMIGFQIAFTGESSGGPPG